MPSLSQRMRKLQHRLLAIRLGSGALILPREVKKIHMRFAQKIEGGHMGPRKFWRHELVRLQYHNPTIPMTIDRFASDSSTQDNDAVMSVHFGAFTETQPPASTSTSTSSPLISHNSSSPETSPPTPTQADRIETIPMKNRLASEILTDLITLTKAQPVLPSPEEEGELRALEEQKVRGERDRRMSLEARARVKREKELLTQARGELAEEG